MANRPIKIKIDVTKIDKAALYKGAKGTYLDAVIWPNKNGKGQYGDTHYIVQEVSRERREAGEKGSIIGNATAPEEQPRQQTQARPAQTTRKPPPGTIVHPPPESYQDGMADDDLAF